MKVSGFNEAVAIAVARDQSYRPEGYQFLRESLEATLKKRHKSKSSRTARQSAEPMTSSHVTAGELLEGFRLQALREFGPMAVTVLEYWGVKSSRDVGQMVFNLVEAGAFGRTESDSIEDFDRGFDFHEAFVAPFLPPPVAAPDSPDSPDSTTAHGSSAAESLPTS
jgi:uncharacterized repeat protein (TIGR04138 family)